MQTQIKRYDAEWKMNRDIKSMERKGWMVSSIQREEGRYGCLATGCLGLLFLPLALLGKSKGKWVVMYQKQA